MKRSAFALLLAAGALTAGFLTRELTPNAMAQSPEKPAATGKYRHVVVFKFKDDAPKEKIDEVVKSFVALKGKIPALLEFEWGENVSPENHHQGFTHVFTGTFRDKESLETGYLHHPAHEAFVAQIKPVLEKAFVVDYVAH